MNNAMHSPSDGTSATGTTGRELTTDCVIVGGGPCGLMLGLILARAGVDVVVLEKHPDFLRDFRGDTIHPSTQELLAQLGLLEQFLALPHTDMPRATFSWRGEGTVTIADFSHLPTQRKAISFMPQWDFLDLLARAAEALPNFRLLRSTRFETLIDVGERVTGVVATDATGPMRIGGRLVVAADGRNSDVRAAAGLPSRAFASPMDVLWFRLPREVDEHHALMAAGAGILIAIDRGEAYQLAQIIPSGSWHGSDEDVAALRERVRAIDPGFADRMDALTADDVKLLRVRLDRLRRWWRPGLLLIGDAAHAMSPAGGIGINIAVQDAVAAANLLAPVLAHRTPTPRELRAVQRRRALPVAITQTVQRAVQNGLLSLDPQRRLPMPVRVVSRSPRLQRLTGRFVGLGVRPERIDISSDHGLVP